MMGLREKWEKHKKKKQQIDSLNSNPEPVLRDFVYLDEQSLQSLLSSTSGEIADHRSESTSEGINSEFGASIGAGSPSPLKAEVSSRFQATDTRMVQTSRRATVQSWFRDFHKIANLKLLDLGKARVEKKPDLSEVKETSLLASTSQLRRGELIELRVRLAPDPVYSLSAVMSEYAYIAQANPDMFGASDKKVLSQLLQVNTIMERLLVGLIPIKATAIDYSVYEANGELCIIHNDLIQNASTAMSQLKITGVTDHSSYWKDLRRVLFADSEFTLLGRISQSGIKSTWTPVKLADVFGIVKPDLVHQFQELSQMTNIDLGIKDSTLMLALRSYAQTLLAQQSITLGEVQQQLLEERICGLRSEGVPISSQCKAFSVVRELLQDWFDIEIDPSDDVALREQARNENGLSLFGTQTQSSSPIEKTQPNKKEHLLEVEIIAIYW
ncbi:MAG: hypothetical protein LBG99_02265 [Propionibacteriaceae bacterium]|jgi:hypothetical protein|nr:hypothetical protein [Propionibacteriaceae bacterium]